MAKRKETEPEDPGLLARRADRQAADAAWFELRSRGGPDDPWSIRVEVISGLLQQAKITTAAGDVLKVWRHENGFRMAINEKLQTGEIDPADLKRRIWEWAKR